MKKLLQELWDQYCILIDEIGGTIDDELLDKEPYISLEKIITDTTELADLRQKLFNAGVQRIAGFRYPEEEIK